MTTLSVENTANWSIGGVAPTSAVAQGTSGVLLGLATPLGSELTSVVADGVEDAAANTRTTEYCLEPGASGIPQPVTVTFQVNTNSGMGISSDHTAPTAFYVNGSDLPLEWGTPPFTTTPLTAIPGLQRMGFRRRHLPGRHPGRPALQIHWRHLRHNTYEAISLANFADAARPLSLNTNGNPQTVVDYLGAAAYPLRNRPIPTCPMPKTAYITIRSAAMPAYVSAAKFSSNSTCPSATGPIWFAFSSPDPTRCAGSMTPATAPPPPRIIPAPM